ncbi:MAG: heavy metal-binding domain-containing protein [Bacteroidota bacterium]
MKTIKFVSLLALVFSLSLFLSSCGGHSHGDGEHGHHHGTEEAEHTQEGDHTHGDGKAYTSAYVCPMHCVGSGSPEAGDCPVCGMEYVALEAHTKDGHKHE